MSSCSATSRSMRCFIRVDVSNRDIRHKDRRTTWKPLITIFSLRAQVKISLRKTWKVGIPILVSAFSWFPSAVVKSDGGGAAAGGGGTSHMALYKASYMNPACSLVNLASVFRFLTAERLEKDSILLTISFLYFLRSERIVSSEITANSRNEIRSSSWKRVIALVRGSADSGCAESPSEAKYSRIKLVVVSISCQRLNQPTLRSLHRLVFAIAFHH